MSRVGHLRDRSCGVRRVMKRHVDFRHSFEDLSIIIDNRQIGLFSGQFEMTIDSTGDAYIETIHVDTTDGSPSLVLRAPSRAIVGAFMFYILSAALDTKYRDVLDAYADAHAPADCGYGPTQRERL